MARVDDLEDELASGEHTSEMLAVYGDALQSAGDIRGEMIATDLALDREPGSAKLVKRRAELVRKWLGEIDERWVQVKYGFVQHVTIEALEKILDGAGGAYVRAIQMRVHSMHVESLCKRIAAGRRRWLRSFEILTTSGKGKEFLVGAEVGAAVIEATPHLERLVVDGARVLAEFPHPAVKRLAIRGWSAIKAGFQRGGRMGNVEQLELGLVTTVGDWSPVHETQIAKKLLAAENFPAVRELDVSHNVRHRGHGASASIFRVLGAVGVVPQIAVLRVPAIESSEHTRDVAKVLGAATKLERLEIMGHGSKTFEHARAQIVVRPRPWPARDQRKPDLGLQFVFGKKVVSAAIEVIAQWLEERFDSLDEETRNAWTCLFQIGQDEDETVSHALLARALDSLTDLPAWDRGWVALREESLRTRKSVKSVVVSPTRMQYGE